MITSRFTISGAVGGVVVPGTISRSAGGQIGLSEAFEAPAAGVITATVVTMSPGHGLATGDLVNATWLTGERRGCSVVVAGNSATVSGGAGDALPSGATVIELAKVVVSEFAIDGDLAQLIAFVATASSVTIGVMEGGSESLVLRMEAADPVLWASGPNSTGPFAGLLITELRIAAGFGGTAGTLVGGTLYDTTVPTPTPTP